MEEEKFMISFVAAIIGVLPILFLSLIACGKKKSGKTLSSKQKPSKTYAPSSTLELLPPIGNLSASSKKAWTSKSNGCAECERFDTEINAALKPSGNKTLIKLNECIINGHVIKSKKCLHTAANNRLEISQNEKLGTVITFCFNNRS